MFEPKVADPHPEFAKTYPQKVFCKQRNCEADVVAANWSFSEGAGATGASSTARCCLEER